jgi:sulfite exporter TauE/SafE
MGTLLAAILAASLVGSLHCAGMCGPFVAFVVGAGPGPRDPEGGSARGNAKRRVGGRASAAAALRLQGAYHLARGIGYTALGAAAGAAGRFLDLAGVLAGAEPLAAGLAGATLVVMGLFALARVFGDGSGGGRLARLAAPITARLRRPEALSALLRRVQTRALALPPTTRALAIGATTTFLPCGWLYAFAVTAAGTGSAWRGAAVLAVFWVGTLPVLVTLGAAVRGAARALGPRFQALASAALVALGLWTLVGRAGLEPLALARTVEGRAAASSGAVPSAETPPSCCSGDALDPLPTPPDSPGPEAPKRP